jgi:HEAT repeat protein
MTTKANVVADLVKNLVAGIEVRLTCKRLSNCGRVGVDAILDALEGKHGQPPKNRHARDLSEDLQGALFAIASVNPDPLIEALNRRPQHAFPLIWALGGSSDNAAVSMDTLVEYSKHQDQWVRWAAIEGLVRLRKKAILQPLLVALRDRSDMVCFSAIKGLEKIADHTAIEPLKRYLERKRVSPGGRKIAMELLAKLEKAG